MKTIEPDYNNCLTNVTNSLLKYYNIPHKYETIHEINEELMKDYQNVVLLLYDGMGSLILNKLSNSFINMHKVKNILSVFPSTTTAATTSVLSGLNPSNHGWLGWDLYFSKVGKTITMFTNNYKDTDESCGKESFAHKYYPYDNIIDLINKEHKAYIVSPFCSTPYNSFDDMLEKIKKLCQKKEKKFIYGYFAELDKSLHMNGCDSEVVIDLLREIDSKTEALCNSVDNTLFIIVADHGHINSYPIYLDDYTDLYNLLVRTTSIEPRACNFFVKDVNKFKELFLKYFKDDFLLYTKKEVLEKKLFGLGEHHPLFEDSLGDFLAISISDKHLLYNHDCLNMRSMHAGITENEMLIPLVMIGRK